MEARLPRTRSRFGGRAAKHRKRLQLPLPFLAASGLVAVLVGAGLLAYTIAHRHARSSEGAFAAPGEYAVYARFGTSADVIYEAPSSRPAERRKLLEIPHAREFGIVPALAPDGLTIAYTVLPLETLAPAPDSPAELWLASIGGDRPPRRLGSGFDLLVRPSWTSDGHGVVVRRSAGPSGPYELLQVDAATGATETLVGSDAALFPVGFAESGNVLYYAAVHQAGSDLYRLDAGSGAVNLVSHLADELTRDWTLSPDGGKLAFLSLARSGDRVSSRVQVLDLGSGAISSPSALESDEFGPAWSPFGELTFGRLAASRPDTGVVVGDGALAAPARGFDVPLAWSRSGSSVAVRTFDGASVTAPGRPALALLRADGARQALAYGEVTFIGWTYR